MVLGVLGVLAVAQVVEGQLLNGAGSMGSGGCTMASFTARTGERSTEMSAERSAASSLCPHFRFELCGFVAARSVTDVSVYGARMVDEVDGVCCDAANSLADSCVNGCVSRSLPAPARGTGPSTPAAPPTPFPHCPSTTD